jgi:hypothetical protein
MIGYSTYIKWHGTVLCPCVVTKRQTVRGRKLSWEENVEIRGGTCTDRSARSRCRSQVFFRDPDAAEQVGLKFAGAATRV